MSKNITDRRVAFVVARASDIIIERGLTPGTCTEEDLKSAVNMARGEFRAFLTELLAGETDTAKTIRAALCDDVYGRLTA